MSTPRSQSIAAVARAELARRNISRTEAAQALGISRTRMWSRLRGDTPLTVADLEKLATLTGLPVTEFMPIDTTTAAASAA